MILSLLDQAIEEHRSGNLVAAERLYLEALRLSPKDADALALLGVLNEAQGHYEKAAAYVQQAIDQDPKSALFYFYLGNILQAQNKGNDACEAYKKSVGLRSTYAPAQFYLGLSLNRLQRHEEALDAYRCATVLDPGLFEVWDNLALTYQTLGRFDEAHQAFVSLLKAANNDLDDATLLHGDEANLSLWHYHLALLELRMGDYSRGFARYRSRFKSHPRPLPTIPAWRGEDLSDKTVMVYAEQGAGDTLMLARFLPILKKKVGRLFFMVPEPLLSLFQGWNGVSEVIGRDVVFPRCDCALSCFDVPHFLETTVQTVPADFPYLPNPGSQRAKTILTIEGKRKIGLCWAGNPTLATDKLRSVPLDLLASIFECQDCAFYSLTRDKADGDESLIQHFQIMDLAPAIQSFADTAAIMTQMDLIISCDTANAHLSAGLGRPTWTLLPTEPDWRWGQSGVHFVWYPAMRLFRQTKPGDWTAPIAELSAALRSGS